MATAWDDWITQKLGSDWWMTAPDQLHSAYWIDPISGTQYDISVAPQEGWQLFGPTGNVALGDDSMSESQYVADWDQDSADGVTPPENTEDSADTTSDVVTSRITLTDPYLTSDVPTPTAPVTYVSGRDPTLADIIPALPVEPEEDITGPGGTEADYNDTGDTTDTGETTWVTPEEDIPPMYWDEENQIWSETPLWDGQEAFVKTQVETDLQDEETAGAEVAGYEFIDTDGDGRNDAIVDADGNVMWDLDQVREYIDAAAATGASLPDMETWLLDNGFIAPGESVQDFLQPPAITAAPTPPELQTLGLEISDTDGDGQIDAIVDADGNVVYQFSTPTATINVIDANGDGVNDTIVDESGNTVMQLSELNTGTDVTTTDAYQNLGDLADLLASGGITEEDQADALDYAAQLFGMTAEEYTTYMGDMLEQLSGGIGAQEGLSEDTYNLLERNILSTSRNAELRAERLLDNVLAETGSATRYYSEAQDLLYDIQNTELQGYIALAQQDYEAQVANYEAQEQQFAAMVEAGNASRSEYLDLVATNRANALSAYNSQVQAIIDQNAQLISASLQSRQQEYDFALQKYGLDLESFLATQTNWLDAISKLADITAVENEQALSLYGQESANWQTLNTLNTEQWQTYTDQVGEYYDNDIATLSQVMENLYAAANAEFGLNTEVLDYLMTNAEFDWAEMQQELDALLSAETVEQAEQETDYGWLFSLLEIAGNVVGAIFG